LLRIDADLLPWTMLLIVALIVSASASGLHDAAQRAPEPDAVRAGLMGGGPAGCVDSRLAGCEPAAGSPQRVASLPAAGFQPGSAELPEALTQPLQVIGQALREQRAVVRVEVHSDASGSGAANVTLSQRRADTIRLFLIEQGVDPYRVLAVGMGSSRPIIASDPLAASNRRIEIVRL
jgi:outer membrane protein OmpA-like peptidoglycan-associated protein